MNSLLTLRFLRNGCLGLCVKGPHYHRKQTLQYKETIYAKVLLGCPLKTLIRLRLKLLHFATRHLSLTKCIECEHINLS